ncbi:MAG: DCC1-like thiol-disulfide oxidoreductase family protein [Prolixibacteraceae bacterium]|jgi:predicted DCC family thiol-disulfide oxidoreductase YuxK|nr:DCC1-like thiol-disulfide oxidoreductase family protein [Prolixibacteraceae bacterium]
MNQTDKQTDAPIILFDGVCNLCNAAVQFVLKHEKEEIIRFATLQNPETSELLTPFQNVKIYDSVLFIEDGKLHQESDAALTIARYLKFYRHLYFLMYLPRWFRNPVYRFIARNRYKWFGKREQCMIPDKKVKHRFL